jgi:hypothetical protein
MALAVAIAVGLLKEAGAPAALVIAGSAIGYLLLRRLRGAPGRA